MAQNLWYLRKRRGLSVQQLASKAGILVKTLESYENGEPVRASDMNRLAKVLYVDAFDVKVQSEPKLGKAKPKPKPSPTKSAQMAPPKKKAAPEKKSPPSSHPARPGQIAHLLQLGVKLGQDETAVTEAIGKPLSELTFPEVRKWLNEYNQEIQELKATRPPDTRRTRTHQPEAVDAFEANYLRTRQEAADWVTFTLLDGTVFNGRVIGFSNYNITIRQEDDTEVTLQKLALAYYSVQPQGVPA